MFTDHSNDVWDSTENQDAFIEGYFGKVSSKSGQSNGVQTCHSVQKFMIANCENDLVNAMCNSVKNKKKRSLNEESESYKKKRPLNEESESYKKKLAKFLSSFEDLDEDVIELPDVVNQNCQMSEMKRKRKKKQSLLLLNNEEPDKNHMKFGSEIECLPADKIKSKDSAKLNDTENHKSKKKKRNKNKTKKHKDPSLNSDDENNTNDCCSEIGTVDADSIISNDFTENISAIAHSKNQTCKKREKKLKSKNEKALRQDISKSAKSCVGDRISSVTSASKSSAFQTKINQKLQAAKFRYLNEMLYKSPGQEALSYFEENIDEFEDYHIGYQSQVSKWPLNPVDVIIQEICQTNKGIVIADLGCGTAKIAERFQERTVHSFDLIALKDCVTACDMANVPLPSSSVDIAVFCLSLMGTNWKDYVRESHRILKLGGVLKIAEIESRIENVNLFIKNIENFGFSLENQDLSHKMFIFLNFKKTSKSKKNNKVPDVTLKPCLYKKR